MPYYPDTRGGAFSVVHDGCLEDAKMVAERGRNYLSRKDGRVLVTIRSAWPWAWVPRWGTGRPCGECGEPVDQEPGGGEGARGVRLDLLEFASLAEAREYLAAHRPNVKLGAGLD